MLRIGSLIHEIDVKIVRYLIKANKLLLSKTSSHVLSDNINKGKDNMVHRLIFIWSTLYSSFFSSRKT